MRARYSAWDSLDDPKLAQNAVVTTLHDPTLAQNAVVTTFHDPKPAPNAAVAMMWESRVGGNGSHASVGLSITIEYLSAGKSN